MIGVSCLFQYEKFVKFIHGSDWDLGWIVGIGAVGSVVLRFVQGASIDQYGVRGIWTVSMICAAVGSLGHLWVEQANTPLVYILQALYRTGIAGAFGSSISFTTLRAGPAKMAEAVGLLGSSGFLALLIGPRVGDYLLSGAELTRQQLDLLFIVASVMMALSLCFAYGAMLLAPPLTQHHSQTKSALIPALKKYHSWPLILMGIMMGMGLAFPGIFVRGLASELGIAGIGTFFTGYAISAFSSRVMTKSFPDYYGERAMILAGMASLILGVLAFMLVREDWHFLLPAVLIGNAHAWLFPSIVTGGSRRFPVLSRGLGTSLMLATFDFGGVIVGPLCGGLIQLEKALLWPTYWLVISSLVAVFTLSAAWYAWFQSPSPTSPE
jgi:MFS family permease